MAKSRSLTPSENEHVCAAVHRLMEEYGSQTAVAQVLQMPDGSPVSQASVSLALRRAPVGVTFARAVAMHIGISFEELVTGALGRTDGRQRHRELPGWDDAAAEVLREEALPRYAVAAAGECIVSFPIKRVDATLVYDVGAHWLKHAPLEVRKAAEKTEILAERARMEADDEARYGARVQSEATERGSHVADVPAARPKARHTRA